MQYKPKSIPALHIALGGLPSKMRVEADPDIGVSVTTVGELRKVTAWPENLVITTPQDHHPESAVKVSKAVRRQRSLDRPGGLNKGEFLAHRNVHRSEDETANPSIEGTS